MEPNNSASGSEPKTSLFEISTDGGRPESTELLPFRTDHEIRLLFFQAIRRNDAQKVDELLNFGVDLNVTVGCCKILLHEALSCGASVQIIRGLLRHGSDVHAIDEHGNTALHVGLKLDASVQCITELLNHGADPNITNHRGMCSLRFALLFEADLQVVRALIDHGAQVNSIDNNVLPLLDFCVLLDVPMEYIELLVQCGANISITGRMERNALYDVLFAETKLPLAKLFVKYTLIRTFAGDSRHHFSLNAYRQFRNYNAAACYFDECILELVKMNTMKVNDRVSLFTFVTTMNSNTLIYFETEISRTIIQKEKLTASYPIYSDIILPIVMYALERGMLFRKLNEIFIYSRNYHGLLHKFGEKARLNYDCAFIIAKNVPNVDLCNLMLAFYSSKSCARISCLKKRLLESPIGISIKKARLK